MFYGGSKKSLFTAFFLAVATFAGLGVTSALINLASPYNSSPIFSPLLIIFLMQAVLLGLGIKIRKETREIKIASTLIFSVVFTIILLNLGINLIGKPDYQLDPAVLMGVLFFNLITLFFLLPTIIGYLLGKNRG